MGIHHRYTGIILNKHVPEKVKVFAGRDIFLSFIGALGRSALYPNFNNNSDSELLALTVIDLFSDVLISNQMITMLMLNFIQYGGQDFQRVLITLLILMKPTWQLILCCLRSI